MTTRPSAQQTYPATVRVSVLGAIEVSLQGAPVDLRTHKQRATLTALTLHINRTLSADALVDLVWGERPPAAVTATLQAYIARLRRALEPDRPARAASTVLLTRSGGYSLSLPHGDLDAAQFEDQVARSHEAFRRLLAVPARVDLDRVDGWLSSALELWRGIPYSELDEAPAAMAERARLEELRLGAMELRARVALALGHHATVAAELEALTSAHPLREGLWALRATALVRSERQADALEVMRSARTVLADELGLDPGPALRELELAVLRQDPGLQWTAPRAGPGLLSDPPASSTDPASASASASIDGSGSMDGVPVAGHRPGRASDPGWPLVGRRQELADLTASMRSASQGPARFAVVTGEAGIGKSRLSAALVKTAGLAGTTVLTGRCSSDEGAPPLWAWASVLRDLGLDLPFASDATAATDEPHSQFRAWEDIVGALLDASSRQPVLLVLEDLHWADTSTLRVLRLLAETASDERLFVISTWRTGRMWPQALSDTAEVLARRHALRCDLVGFDSREITELAAAVEGSHIDDQDAEVLRVRTDGNPFFLVELLRANHRSSPTPISSGPSDPTSPTGTAAPTSTPLPTAVQDVLNRRLADLDPEVLQTVQVASVIGRTFDLQAVAAGSGRGEEEILDDLDRALDAGLLVEDGIDEFRFTHALVRDAAYAAISMSRRGRLHARVASVLEGRPRRETEVALHWRAAGERHVAQAWRAAMVAAEWARGVFAYDEALTLTSSGLAMADTDPLATLTERHDLLLSHARTLQLADGWVELRPTIHRAISLARDVGDLERVVASATLPLTGALWQAAGHGFVDDLVVDALRELLHELPARDTEARCRVMLSLAGELYYGASALEREALVEEAIAMARRLGDDSLLMWACVTGATAIWRASTAAARLRLLDDAIELATRLSDAQVLSSALTLRATALMELGRIGELEEALAQAREQAEQQRHLFAQMVLDSVEIPLHCMRGEIVDADRLIEHLVSMSGRWSMFADAIPAMLASRAMWTGHTDQLVAVIRQIDADSPLPTGHWTVAMLARSGRLAEAQERREEGLPDLDVDVWFSPMLWASAGEAALHLRSPDLGAAAYRRMTGLAGTTANTGSFWTGPMDAFLAMAAAAMGDRRLASRHADEADRLCIEWRTPRVREWLADTRAAYDF